MPGWSGSPDTITAPGGRRVHGDPLELRIGADERDLHRAVDQRLGCRERPAEEARLGGSGATDDLQRPLRGGAVLSPIR